MCCDNHCLLCTNTRIACLIFGYLSAFLTGVGSIVSTGIAMLYGITLVFEPLPYYYTAVNFDSDEVEWKSEWLKFHGEWNSWTIGAINYTSKIVNLIIASGLMWVLIPSFASSVALLVGITKKNVTYVKAYIIYGIVLVTLLLLLITILGCTFFASGYITFPVAGVGLYCLILYMIYSQYKAMVAEIERIRCKC